MNVRTVLLCSAAFAIVTPAFAQSDPEELKRLDAMQQMIE